MKLNDISKLKDKRTDRFSIIFEVRVQDYLDLEYKNYKDELCLK